LPFQLSPGVAIVEVDLTTIVPAVASTDGALAGVFRWGPVKERVLVDGAPVLVTSFLGPTTFNAETFFTGANFLDYGNRLFVVRAANTNANTPSFNGQINGTTNSVVIMTGANSTHSPLTLGIDNSYHVFFANLASNGATILVGNTRVTGVNATSVTLESNSVGNGAVFVIFDQGVGARNALALEQDGVVANPAYNTIGNRTEYLLKDGTFDTDVTYIARWPGLAGNSLRVSQCDRADQWQSNIALSNAAANVSGVATSTLGNNVMKFVFTLTDNTSPVSVANTNATRVIDSISINDLIQVGNSIIGRQYLKVVAIDEFPTVNSTAAFFNLESEDPYRLHSTYTTNTVPRYWEFYGHVDTAPGQSEHVFLFGNNLANDELHVVVVDNNGVFTGEPGLILEVFRSVSRATDALTTGGAVNYYKDVINQGSQYIWYANDRANAPSANAALVSTSSYNKANDVDLTFGTDGLSEQNVHFGALASAWDMFGSAEDIDISLVMQGYPIGGVFPSTGVENFQLANYLIDNIAEVRKDCVAFVSPDKNLMVHNAGDEALDIVDWRNALHSSSYAVMDTGYKYQYDRYNDVFRWIPMNGDIAGLCARTDMTNDPWWSPAGLNRGQIKNLIYLAFNPRHSERDILYKNGVNPVVTFPGIGTVLFGDKTLQARPSAFDRINVRRLFIVIEKAISTAAKYFLFEFNDSFTRAQFKNMVNPYLRDVQGRRGITDFLVVCDQSNNPGEVVDRNEFVGDIYIKPARSINFIQLNFIAVRTDVQFSEVVGKF